MEESKKSEESEGKKKSFQADRLKASLNNSVFTHLLKENREDPRQS